MLYKSYTSMQLIKPLAVKAAMPSLGSFFTILATFVLVLSPVSSARAQSPSANQDSNAANRSVRIGDRIYQVTVIDNETGETILTFGLSNTFSARAFLIDEGETVAIAQSLSMNPPFEEVTTFLDIDTGEEITRLPERVYGFSEDESLLVTRAPQEMAIHSYPSLTQRCRLTGEYWGYPIGNQFSPNHRFLLVYVFSMDIDMRMPTPSTGEVGWFQLFDIEECEKVSEFPERWIISDPVFSDDSRFLYLGEGHVCLREGIEDNCRFNLSTYEVETF